MSENQNAMWTFVIDLHCTYSGPFYYVDIFWFFTKTNCTKILNSRLQV